MTKTAHAVTLVALALFAGACTDRRGTMSVVILDYLSRTK